MLYLILSILCYVVKDVANHTYGKKITVGIDESVFQNAIVFTVATLICTPFCGDYNIPNKMILLGILFGICYAVTNITLVLAFCSGPAGPSSMMVFIGTMGGVLFGILFCNENLSFINAIGIIAMLLTAILLKPEKSENDKNIKRNWFIFALSAMLLNMIFTSVKKGAIYFNPDFNVKLYTTIGLAFAALVCWIMVAIRGFVSIIKIKNSNQSKSFIACSVIPGLAVGGATMFQMLAIEVLPSYIVYPFNTAGTPLIMCFISIFVLKELKMSKKIILALAFCISGAIMLSV